MDLNRRTAQGRLSELFGKATLELDKKMRTLNMYAFAEEDAKTLPNTTLTALNSFVRVCTNFLYFNIFRVLMNCF